MCARVRESHINAPRVRVRARARVRVKIRVKVIPTHQWENTDPAEAGQKITGCVIVANQRCVIGVDHRVCHW